MAVYKVIQDIESEDKLLGPLTLKAFIYAAIAAILAYINFRLLLVGSPIKWLVIFIFSWPMVLFGVLASPLGREQPTEVWLLSRIRYYLKPRERIWDQEGMSEYVTVTAPKKPEVQLTKNLSKNEVQSRLKTLATTLDTRGWAIKNVDVNLSVPEVEANNTTAESDRLVGAAGLPQQMPVVDVHASDDIMDEKHNPTAIKVDSMMKQAETKRKHGILEALKNIMDTEEQAPKPKPKHHKIDKPAPGQKNSKQLPVPQMAMEKARRLTAAERARKKAEWEAQIAEKLATARSQFGAEFNNGRKKPDPAHHVVGPIRSNLPEQPPVKPVTAARQPVNMDLAQSGNAFSVATLSQLASNRQPKAEQTGPDELTVSLH
jgi:hypothetical protein